MKPHPDAPETGLRRTSGKLPPGARHLFLQKIREWPGKHYLLSRLLVLGCVFLAAITLFPKQEGTYHLQLYRLGTIQPKAVIAEFDFDIRKDPAILRQEQAEAASAVPPVLVYQDSVKVLAFSALANFEQSISALRRDSTPQDPMTEEERDVALSQSTYLALLTLNAASIFAEARLALAEYYRQGIVSADLEDRFQTLEQATLITGAANWVGSIHRFYGPTRIQRALAEIKARDSEGEAVTELVERFSWPNVTFDEERTLERQLLASDGVEQSIGRVLKGEKIVGAHERIVPDILRKLESYEYWRPQKLAHQALQERISLLTGRLMLLALLLIGLTLYLIVYQKSIIREFNDLLLISITFAGFLLLGALVLKVLHLSSYLIPIGGYAVMMALLYDEKLALVISGFLTLMVGLLSDLGFTFLLVTCFGSVAAIMSVHELRDRRQVYRLMLYVPLIHLITLIAMGLVTGVTFEEMLFDMMYLVSTPFLSAFFALFVVPGSEAIFGKCTNLTLLELLDLNRPLLRRLMLEAPGTYHHSLMVGTLAEAGASAISANPLMARVQGYYHDIGKIKKPEYFIENQMAGRKNPHDKLSPTMSRLILESHVRDGLKLAKENKLPKVVSDAIAQHHGTGVMSYFFHRAKSKDPHTSETEYRYPGPRPRSRELAIVLLADQIDAASRSLEEPTPSRLRGLIKQLLENRALEGELDESQLTIKDLAALRDAFIPILTALFHGRITYPKTEPRSAKTQTGHAGESAAKAEG